LQSWCWLLLKKSKKKSSEISNLHDNLNLLHNVLRKKMKKEWNRVLPFDELLFDRWDKAEFIDDAFESALKI